MLDEFLAFMRNVVLPRQTAHPTHVRLDGETKGGSRVVVGRFRYRDRDWVVHADTHYTPLGIAYQAALSGADPFVEELTQHGRCLALASQLRSQQGSRHKYLYIYSWC